MKRLLQAARVAAYWLLPLFVSASVPALQGCGGGDDSNCCKVCDKGKACGDSCIAENQACNSPGGCACNK